MRKRFLAGVLSLFFAVNAAGAYAEIEGVDFGSLGRLYRKWFTPYAQQADAPPIAAEIAEAAAALPRDADPTERYKTLIKGLAVVFLGEWNEASEVATIFDMRLPAKLFEPGDTVGVKVFPLYEREKPIEEHYMVHVRLLDAEGNAVGEPGEMHFHELIAEEIPLEIPSDLPAGRYGVVYSIEPHRDHGGPPTLTAHRNIFVLPNLRQRLGELDKMAVRFDTERIAVKSRSHALGVSTVKWHLDIHHRARREDVPGAYSASPIFMTHIRTGMGMAIERIDFAHELDQAEGLADMLLRRIDPLRILTGDMRLAYSASDDGELVPFRIYIPEDRDLSKTYPLVIALHGAGGDENSFMDRYDGLFKANARERGYYVVAVNGRGGAYRGRSEQDTLDVLDIVQHVFPVEKDRTYLTGHSMGGGGTIRIGFDHPERFAALAAIAGFGNADQLAKAKDMPLLLTQGDQDQLVPVTSARAFYQRARELGMPEVKYVEMAGVDHYVVGPRSMELVFDWFDQH